MCLAIPGKIIEIYETGGLLMGKLDFGGVTREACLQAVPEAKVDDYVIIHAGFALNILSQQEAMETFEALEELAKIEEALDGEESNQRDAL